MVAVSLKKKKKKKIFFFFFFYFFFFFFFFFYFFFFFGCFFFFQAEDGIRDRDVTGVQTCALPISGFDGDVEGLVACPSAQARRKYVWDVQLPTITQLLSRPK